jgi:hypothetical protein
LQQRLGDRENALAAEFVTLAKFEILHFACKRSFCHESLRTLAALHHRARRPTRLLINPSKWSCNGLAAAALRSRAVRASAALSGRWCQKMRKKSPLRQLVRRLFYV